MPDADHIKEEVKVTAENLVDEIKRLIHEGNVTHIAIKNEKGEQVFEIPVTAALVGVALLPVLAGVGLLVGYAAHYTLVITRNSQDITPDPTPQS